MFRGEKDDDDRNVFRKWFSYVGECFIFLFVLVLVLSVICIYIICRRVCKVLNLKDDVIEIWLLLDKLNIKLVVKKILNFVDLGMVWIID